MTNAQFNDRSRLDARYGMTLVGATALAAGAGLAGGLAQHLDGSSGKAAVAAAVAAAAAALSLTFSAMASWAAARRRDSGLSAPNMAQLALPAPAAPKPSKRAEAQTQARAQAPPADPRPSVDAERARLKAAGYSDAEISQIVVAREAGGHGGAALGSGIATGVLSNIGAVVAYVRSFLPGLKADVVLLLDGSASAGARGGAALSLAFKAAVIGVVAYITSLELQQLQATVAKTHAEACKAAGDALLATVPMDRLGEATLHLTRQCPP